MRFVPSILPTVVIGDNARLMARVATAMSRKRSYLPLVDGPRMGRPDVDHEVIRRTNLAAALRPERVVLVDLPASTRQLMAAHLPASMMSSIDSHGVTELEGRARLSATLKWGKDKIGLGLLLALRKKHSIAFDDARESPTTVVDFSASHVVVCEEVDEHAQVLAANYAFSIGAGLQLLPAFPDDEAEAILESFYSGHENPGEGGIGATLRRLKNRLRAHGGALHLSRGVTLTFITKKLPWGFAFAEHPSTHLFFTDLGLRLAYGILHEQPDSAGIRAALAIDPKTVSSNEIDPVLDRLTENGAICKALRKRRATVYQASHNIRLFPYDFLLISTHCGDASGYRWTYEFTDSEGRNRRLVVDLAVSLELTKERELMEDQDEVRATEFVRFVSLDGVDWNDREAKKNLYVGTAIRDFIDRVRDKSFEPTHREDVHRVRDSMALQMADGTFIPLPEAIASRNSPIVFNNACGSWHRLAGDFMFSGARCYLGTLFSVMDGEVEQVVGRLFGKYYDKELAIGLWRAQNEVYRDDVRRPYILSGCHFQRLLTRDGSGRRSLRFVLGELATAVVDWRREFLRLMAAKELDRAKTTSEFVKFLSNELTAFREFAAGRISNAYRKPRAPMA